MRVLPRCGTCAREDLGWVRDGALPAGHLFFFVFPSHPGPSYLVERVLETHADFLTGISNMLIRLLACGLQRQEVQG